jgi:hypothetical protein
MQLSAETIVILLIMLVITALIWLHYSQARAGRRLPRRPLPALDVMLLALGRGAETGRATHISPGAGTINNRSTTAETVVGLLAAERVAAQAARNGAPVLASSGDAVSHLALRGMLRQSYQRAGQAQDYHPSYAQLLAHQDTMAYAAGVMGLYGRQQFEASQLLGGFNQDFLLLGEDGAQRHIPQVAGATSTSALPVVLLSTPNALIGEEIFAAEAYLSDDASSDSRLRTQDALRIVVMILIVGGFVYNLLVQPLLEPFIPLPALPGL